MTIPNVTDKQGWETLTLESSTMDKGPLCSAYRTAAKRVHEVKGLGKAARDAVKDAVTRLDNALTALDTAQLTEPDDMRALLLRIRDAHAAKREAENGVQDLEYHFLEVFMEAAKVALKVRHATKVSVSSKDGSVTFTNGTTS